VDQLAPFIAKNWILVGALLVIVFLLINSFFGGMLKGFKSVSPSEAVLMINRDDAVVLDVREESEYQDGHIINAMHVPLSQLNDKQEQLAKYKDRPIIAACRSGQRSGQACATLKKAGFENVSNVRGGIMSWQNQNMPVTTR
jgi:rhodanese-related sulfurtransferase